MKKQERTAMDVKLTTRINHGDNMRVEYMDFSVAWFKIVPIIWRNPLLMMSINPRRGVRVHQPLFDHCYEFSDSITRVLSIQSGLGKG